MRPSAHVLMGGTGAGSYTLIYPTVMNSVLGTRFKLVTGYQSTAEIGLAMERGEVEGRAGNNFNSLKAENAEWLKTGKITLITQVGLERDAEFPDLPLLTDFAKTDEDRQMLRLFSTDVVIGRPFVTSPGVPAERVALLRKAFDEMMTDPAYLEDSRKARLDVTPVDRRQDAERRRRSRAYAGRHREPRRSSPWNPRTSSSARNEQAAADDRDRGLRSLPRFPPRHRAGGRHRAHLADAGAARDFRALHLQSRMGRERAVVREIHDPGDAQGPRHRGAADRLLAAFPVLGLLRQPNSKITSPADLKGKKVGSPEWAHTAAVYMRGWLADEAGVKLQDVHWYQAGTNEPGRTEKVELSLPKGVKLTRVDDKSLSNMLAAGEIDCALVARPPDCFMRKHPDVVRLFPDYLEMEEKYYARTKVWPIMHVIAMKRQILDAIPGWPAASTTPSSTSKNNSIARLIEQSVSRYPLPWLTTYARRMRDMFDGDPFPFGIEANRPTLEQFLRYTHEQGIAHRHAKVEEIFPDGMMVAVHT